MFKASVPTDIPISTKCLLGTVRHKKKKPLIPGCPLILCLGEQKMQNIQSIAEKWLSMSQNCQIISNYWNIIYGHCSSWAACQGGMKHSMEDQTQLRFYSDLMFFKMLRISHQWENLFFKNSPSGFNEFLYHLPY